jgi:hypothetical protein
MKVKEVLNQIGKLLPIRSGTYCVSVADGRVKLIGPFESFDAAKRLGAEMTVDIKGTSARIVIDFRKRREPLHRC